MKTLSTSNKLLKFAFRGRRVWKEGVECGFDAVDDGLMGVEESPVEVEDDELSRHFDGLFCSLTTNYHDLLDNGSLLSCRNVLSYGK